MRRGRTLIFLLLILLVGLVVAYVVLTQLLPQFLSSRAPQPVSVEVFIAGQNIPQGAKITEDVLATMTIPADKVTAVEFTSDERSQLIGRAAKFPLDQGVVITSSMVTDSAAAVPIAGPQHASQIPPGMTLASIPANRLSLNAYGISDGAHVNVNACYLFVDVDTAFQSITPNSTAVLNATGFPEDQLPVLTVTVGGAGGPQGRLELDPSLQQPFYYVPSEPQRPRPVCQTIVQDVVVMKTGDFSIAAASTDAAAQQPQAAPQPPDIVSLIVSPQDAVTLSYMVYTDAKFSLTLRNPGDQSRLATEAATLQFLLSQYNIPIPAKLPYALQPRIDALSDPGLPNDVAPAQ